MNTRKNSMLGKGKTRRAGFLFGLACTFLALPAWAQTVSPKMQIQALAKQEGEVFVATEVWNGAQQKDCRLEDLFTNTVLFAGDSMEVSFNNYTEAFCEVTTLETKLLYQVRLRDLDPAKVLLGQRNYNLNGKKLLEGQQTWYEVQLNTLNAKPLATERDLRDLHTRRLSQFRIIFKTQAGAKRAQTALRELLK